MAPCSKQLESTPCTKRDSSLLPFVYLFKVTYFPGWYQTPFLPLSPPVTTQQAAKDIRSSLAITICFSTFLRVFLHRDIFGCQCSHSVHLRSGIHTVPTHSVSWCLACPHRRHWESLAVDATAHIHRKTEGWSEKIYTPSRRLWPLCPGYSAPVFGAAGPVAQDRIGLSIWASAA